MPISAKIFSPIARGIISPGNLVIPLKTIGDGTALGCLTVISNKDTKAFIQSPATLYFNGEPVDFLSIARENPTSIVVKVPDGPFPVCNLTVLYGKECITHIISWESLQQNSPSINEMELRLLPSNLVHFQCEGNNTFRGDLAELPPLLTFFVLTGDAICTFSGIRQNWSDDFYYFHYTPISGKNSLSSDEIDALIIELDTLPWTTLGSTINLTGTNPPRTSFSNSAAASLTAKGVNLITNL